MRRLTILSAVAAVLIMSVSASAAQFQGARPSVGAQRNGPIAKLIELERRKNEWLRQRFLGR
ncbi:MAG: hypothetical protein EBR86_00740 [Planctomycetia bacterium]|jgi:hypothetical protein|nr:hypothetical protein [Planctomycetia bacterium]